MKEKNRNCARRFSYIIALFVLIFAGSLYVSEEPGQAKTYSSTKQVKAQIKRLNKKIRKVKKASKKAYARWKRAARGRTTGTADSRYISGACVINGNPLIIEVGNTYYYIKNRISNSFYFTGNIRTTGGYRSINGLICVNAQVVSGSGSTRAANQAAKKYRKYKRQIEDLEYDRYCLKKTLKFKVRTKNKTIYVGRKVKLKPQITYKNKITWKSSNTKIATVNKKGVVTGKKAGKVIITAKTNLSKKTSKIAVKVKGISKLKLELEYSYLTLNEEAILGDVEKIDRVYSSDETVVSTYKEYGYIWIRANSVGKAKITAYGKNAQTTVEILVYEPHIIFEQNKFQYDASSLGTDVKIYFKSNIPTDGGWERGEPRIDWINCKCDEGSRSNSIFDWDIIYEKKKADGMDTLGIMILHLEETGVAQFRLRDTAGQGRYGYDYVSSDIEVSVTGTRLSYSTEIAEDEYITTYLQDELTILNENKFYVWLHGDEIHKVASSDEDILLVDGSDKSIALVPRGKQGTVKLTVFTEETGERIELIVHVCSLDISWDDGTDGHQKTYEWGNKPITSYFNIDFLSDVVDIKEVKGTVIQSDGHIEFGEYRDGKLFFTITGMEHAWEDTYKVRVTVNGFSVERELYVECDRS